MKTPEQLKKEITQIEFTNERLRYINKNQAEIIDFLLSHKPWYYKLFV